MGWGATTLHTFVVMTFCYPLVEELYPLWTSGTMTFDDSADTLAKGVLPMSVFMGYVLSGALDLLVSVSATLATASFINQKSTNNLVQT